ncbi:MAG TPA: Gfo/Idh/MocA family oxidoreductase [Kiritimatiellia bacterium]|nr:Gfo/Idh/MocA family oxidoreductase [Kiritimatiellia bacterium]HMP00182.1 Gfo/Idh/MocA family oxidoreductase [Kiritimatiellia bacterium]HMP96793.1 Gfo/Idh/MocA family oxidoreductase [Kiritimatiellia bacterium]
MNDANVNVGVVGVGSLGINHARIYRELPGCRLAAIFDTDTARAAEVAAQYETQVAASLEELIEAVDAASIVVPTHLHFDVASQLIRAGKHLLVEKPITSTTSEAEELVRLAQEHNVVLQVGHIERFNPVMEYLEKAARHPRFIEAHRLAPFPPPREGMHPRGTEVNVVLDLMIHDLEVILHLVRSPVKEVRAVGVPVLSGSEDIANVRLEFENGCVANITASRISPERMRKIRVFVEDAYISLDYQKQAGEIFRKTGAGIAGEDVPIQKGEPLANELRSFIACAASHGTPKVSGEHAAEALKLAAHITQLMRRRQQA